jgi:putative ABC transport system permease protein
VTRFLRSQLRHRAGRSIALGLGIIVAAVSFVLLTGSAATSAIHVRSTLKQNFRGAYDILVRPKGSFTPLERKDQLVRDNYLSGIYGGITLRQYRSIEHIPGVQVAAPIANIGTVLAQQPVVVSLKHYLRSQNDQLFRVRFSWVAQDGLSRYPASDEYLYVTHRQLTLDRQAAATRDPLTGKPDLICDGYNETKPVILAPFLPVNSSSLFCSSTNSTAALRRAFHRSAKRAFPPKVAFEFEFPINVAAIDPEAEARLVGLSRAMVGGSYLTSSNRPRVTKPGSVKWLAIPAIAASRSLLGERLDAQVEKLTIPPATDTPGMLGAQAGECGNDVPLAAGGCPESPSGKTAAIEPGPPGHRHVSAYQFLRALHGVVVGRQSVDGSDLYARAVGMSGSGLFSLRDINVGAYWRGASVRYRKLGPTTIEPLIVRNAPASYQGGVFTTSWSGYVDQPTDNRDIQFRKLSDTQAQSGTMTPSLNAEAREPLLQVVGRFDPERLRGFASLSHVPLETYYPPTLTAADARTRSLLHNRPLLPSQNLGDYEQQPPLLLTNLNGLAPLLSSQRFTGISPLQRRAPISVIRVRVKGITGPNDLSETRIRTVAQLIHNRTGLDVDITAGSSPTPITVKFPAGKFGRPALTLSEGWVKKGASVSYLRALDRKDIALYALILVVCAVFLLNGALALVRARRSEIGVLLTLGWSRVAIFAAVLGELALVGLVAGAAGTGLAAALVQGFALVVPVTRTLYVLPIALGLALLAGMPPAWEASRGRPLDALRPPVHARRQRGSVRSLPALALVNLARLPIRSLLGGLGLALGVAALTILVAIERAFQGSLVSTVLGNAISLQVRDADFVAIGLTIGLAALSAADVLYLNLRERSAEFATLSSLGWSRRQIRFLVLLEAGLLGAVAALTGAAVGIIVGAIMLGVPVGSLGFAAVIAAAGAFVAALLASLAPTHHILRLKAPAVLAAE